MEKNPGGRGPLRKPELRPEDVEQLEQFPPNKRISEQYWKRSKDYGMPPQASTEPAGALNQEGLYPPSGAGGVALDPMPNIPSPPIQPKEWPPPPIS